MPTGQPSYFWIVAAAVTTFVLLAFGGFALYIGCDIKETWSSDFQRSTCEGPAPEVGGLLALFAPLATAVAGLLSREEGFSPTAFYVLWAASLLAGVAVLGLSVVVV